MRIVFSTVFNLLILNRIDFIRIFLKPKVK